jgi:hypothetical protein
MSDNLARNPKLDEVLRNAVDRVQNHSKEPNHAKVRDDHGMVLSNEGKSSKYTHSKGKHPKRLEDSEMEEATGASSAGSYVGPLFANMDEEEVDEIMESIIKEHVVRILEEKDLEIESEEEQSEGLNYSEINPAYNFKSQGPFVNRMGGDGYNFESQGPLNEKRKKIKEEYFSGKLQYEKPKKSPKEPSKVPGIEVTNKSLTGSKKDNSSYYKESERKLKDYMNYKNNSKPEFPHQNNSKTDYNSPMYRNTSEEDEFIEDFRGMGLEDANGVEQLSRLEDYLMGSTKTGNSQEAGNVVKSDLGKEIKDKIKRKREKIEKQKSKMTNLRGYTPDVQTIEESVKSDMDKMKHLFKYNEKTQ